MPKLPDPVRMTPDPMRDPHEAIDWLRREGYEVVVQNMRAEPGRVQIEIVGYQTRSSRIEYDTTTMSSPYRQTYMIRQTGLDKTPQGAKPTKPAPAEPDVDTFGLAQAWEDVAEWFDC